MRGAVRAASAWHGTSNLKVKKVKFALEQAMKVQRVSRGITVL